MGGPGWHPCAMRLTEEVRSTAAEIAAGARWVRVDEDALGAGDAVEQRRLAGVGLADHGHVDRALVVRRCGGLGGRWELRGDRGLELGDAMPMQGAHGDQAIHPEPVEIRGLAFFAGATRR